MKKIISVCLVCCLMAALLAGCKSSTKGAEMPITKAKLGMSLSEIKKAEGRRYEENEEEGYLFYGDKEFLDNKGSLLLYEDSYTFFLQDLSKSSVESFQEAVIKEFDAKYERLEEKFPTGDNESYYYWDDNGVEIKLTSYFIEEDSASYCMVQCKLMEDTSVSDDDAADTGEETAE